ncbi:MAG: hypothetical protein ABW217_10365 [Polyangiaceae bacterium]
MMRQAMIGIAVALSTVTGGDGGVKQRPVYPGECLARGSDGKLFVARAGEPCVALQRAQAPEAPAVPKHIAEAFADPSTRSLPHREPLDICGMP